MTEETITKIQQTLLPVIGKDDVKFVICSIRAKVKKLEGKKSAHPKYTECMDIYNTFMLSRGFKPKITSADGQGLNELIVFFESFETVKSGTHTLENCFNLVFSNWDKLTPFLQTQISLRQINSYINNILDGIRNNKKQQQSTDLDRRIAEKFANVQDNNGRV